jgi:hypothetical protein
MSSEKVVVSDVPGDVEAEAATKTLSRQKTVDERYSIYTHKQKIAIVIVASVSALISPMTQAILLPALNSIAAELKVSNTLINLTLTSFLVQLASNIKVSRKY